MITIAHLYPRHLNIYGDTGNVLVLRQRMRWRGLPVRVVGVDLGDPIPAETDILLGGGGQDAAQGELADDFLSKGAQLRAMADDGVVMLAICGSYQLLGHEFLTQDGVRIGGVGVLDVVTRGSSTRLIGTAVVDTSGQLEVGRLVGYENHSGKTELGPGVRPIGRVAIGGNDGVSGTEGAIRDNVIGTYLHGPVLAKSPALADELLRRALRRQGSVDELAPLDDELAERAAAVAVTRPR